MTTVHRISTKKTEVIDFKEEIAELHVLLRVLGEEAIMMRSAGKLAEKEKSYFGDIVTEADTLIEREIVKRIQARYPDHCVRGEESGPSKPPGNKCEYEWIVNPIDGTTSFSKGLSFFSIAIALLHAGKPIFGVMYFPELARFIYAVKGEGVYDNGKPLEMFARPPVREMRRSLTAVAISRRRHGRFSLMEKIHTGSLNMMNTGSMSYNCLLLAQHKIDAAIHTDATIFNIAAAIPILEEAGCALSGFTEENIDLSKDHISVIFAENQELLADIKEKILPQWREVEKQSHSK